MTWAIPNWYAAVLLAFAALRCFQLLANDAILQRPRDAVLNNREWLESWVICAWCMGAWITLAWWLCWLWEPRWTLIVATPFAISAIVGLLGRLLPE